jgi:hypothetical protein
MRAICLAIQLAILATLALTAPAMAQPPTPSGQSLPPPMTEQASKLTWMAGVRVHTNANGTPVYEAFVGPVNGVVTGTALAGLGADGAYTEYHRIGPRASDGRYGLEVANTRNNMQWTFTPAANIDETEARFVSDDGKLSIRYWPDGEGGIRSEVIRVGADGKPTTQTWHFKPLPTQPR